MPGRAQLFDLIGESGDLVYECFSIVRLEPLQPQATGVESGSGQHSLQTIDAFFGIFVAQGIVAIARLTGRQQYPIGAVQECPQDVIRVEAGRATDADKSHVGRVR